MAQKKQVLEHICQDLGILPKPKAARIQSKIPASVRTKVEQFYLKDYISWQAPGKRDHKTIKENGLKVRCQKCLYNIRQVYELFIQENPRTVIQCVKQLQKKMPQYSWYIFVKRKQSGYFGHIKENADDTTVVCLADYAENYTLQNQDQMQSAHWSKKQVSIFTAYTWMGGSEVNGYSFGFVSDLKKHDKLTVVTCLEILVQ
ncbi:unnamed protein product [Rotaria magnacalcarata]|uniref:Uncharacterized protein n=3 Tax=Rotaria magnacalcarata TaxID=392030 RepID=A0A816DI38_9BILA|nr:unnamed protein product [Rotaria magnacalcarata]